MSLYERNGRVHLSFREHGLQASAFRRDQPASARARSPCGMQLGGRRIVPRNKAEYGTLLKLECHWRVKYTSQ